MRVTKPTYFIEYPSGGDFRIDYSEEYFYDETMDISLEGLVTFAVGSECGLIYMLDKEGYIHRYNTFSKRLEKSIYHIQVDKDTIFIGMGVWKNIIVICSEKKLFALSLITWQILWEISSENPNNIFLMDKDGNSQINNSNSKLYNNRGIKVSGNISVDTVELPKTISEDLVKKAQYDFCQNLVILKKDGELLIFKKSRVYEASKSSSFTFDSSFDGCEWHKIELLYEDINQESKIEIDIKAYDYSGDVKYEQRFENQKNIYLENAKGRYLEVKITLFSDAMFSSTPVFKRIKVYFPKSTYLRYLPALYREDKDSKVLLQKYLSIFETLMQSVESKIETAHHLIDPMTTKSEFLNWLSLWLGVSRDENWSDEKWREFLANAIYFFKTRGTKEGLEKLMLLYLDNPKRGFFILEPFQFLSDSTEHGIELDAYTFCVLLNSTIVQTPNQYKSIKKIVNDYKPAHTQAKVTLLLNKMILGSAIVLGENSYLTKQSSKLGEATLSIDTRLIEKEDSSQVSIRSRVGIDTKLKY